MTDDLLTGSQPAPPYSFSMITILVASGHSGIAHPRTGPELSDAALFVFACLGVWFVRRGLRRRLPRD